jgi:hypothetical protein
MLVGKLEGKRLLGRPRCRWKYNAKMGLGEKEYMNWIQHTYGTEFSVGFL